MSSRSAREPAMTLRLPLRIGTRGSPLALAQAQHGQGGAAAADPALPAMRRSRSSWSAPRATASRTARWPRSAARGCSPRRSRPGCSRAARHRRPLDEGHADRPARRAGHQRRAAARRPARRADRARPAQHCRAAAGCGGRHGLAAPRTPSCSAVRPDLVVVPLRGNVQTRLRKLDAGEVQATFLAMAGLMRLGPGSRRLGGAGTGGDAAGGGAGCDRHRMPGRRRRPCWTLLARDQPRAHA